MWPERSQKVKWSMVVPSHHRTSRNEGITEAGKEHDHQIQPFLDKYTSSIGGGIESGGGKELSQKLF